jgi:hypothetical protein
MRATPSLRLPDVKGWAAPAFGAAVAAALDIVSPAADLLSGRQAGPADPCPPPRTMMEARCLL